MSRLQNQNLLNHFRFTAGHWHQKYLKEHNRKKKLNKRNKKIYKRLKKQTHLIKKLHSQIHHNKSKIFLDEHDYF